MSAPAPTSVTVGAAMSSWLHADVAFSIVAETTPGDRVFAVGTSETLGAWDPRAALELTTAPETYPQWSGIGRLLAPTCVKACMEYKMVILRQDGGVCWEEGPNRKLLELHCASTAADATADGPRAPPAEAPRFGCAPADGQQAHVVFRISACGIPRDLSTVSTCFPDEDSPRLINSASMTSSACLPGCAMVAEEGEEGEEEAIESAPVALRLWAGAHRTAKPEGKCEDAYFFSASAAGVADGVGSMKDFTAYGVDAADLMAGASGALHRRGAESEAEASAPRERTAKAVAAADAAASTYGASTITVLALEGAEVGVTNLGDSGFMLLRPEPWGGMKLVERSREQNHSFNTPYQLTRVPPALMQKIGGRGLDSPEDGESYLCNVQPGDLLLLYTDGLTDNLHWFEMLKLIDDLVMTPSERASPEAIAKALVVAAQERSLDETAETPFSKNARRHRCDWPGGKIDDVTVVAAWVVPEGDASAVPEGITLSCLHDPAAFRQAVF